jgi:hypothetical protein
MGAGATTLVIRYVYTPEPPIGDTQSRLRIYLLGRAHNEQAAEGLGLLIECDLLSDLYRFTRAVECNIPWDQFSTAYDIVRREMAVPPIRPPEPDDKIPSLYYMIQSSKPRKYNDLLSLDRHFHGIKQPVVVEIAIEPTDVTEERTAHSHYLALLQSIERARNGSSRDEPGRLMSHHGTDHGLARGPTKILCRPRRKHPHPGHILRHQERFHQTLHEPHVLFHIRVFAQSAGIAQLIGWALAESAFEDGTYRGVSTRRGSALFDELVSASKAVRVSTVPTLNELFNQEARCLYARFVRLAHVAPVNEMTSVFLLPVASYSSPRCIRKSSDPKIRDTEDLVVLGYEEEVANDSVPDI